MTLYEIEKAIVNCVDTDTGEIIDFQRLEQLSLDKQIKIDGIACWYKELNSEATAIDAEINVLEERKKAKRNKAENLKKYLSDILDGSTRFESCRNLITWRKSDEVYIIDDALIPNEYKKTIIETKISKVDIKAAIKAGTIVDGADLIYKNNIQIK